MSSPAAPQADLQAEPARRRGTLALVLQEALTAIVRLRANRQAAADAESFRAHLKQLLATADDQSRRAGYDQGTVKRAIYAATVFLDESVLNSSQPMFADWPRKPLQEEIFGGHILDVTESTYTIELTGPGGKLDSFLRAIEKDAILEVVRSGATGIALGQKALHV